MWVWVWFDYKANIRPIHQKDPRIASKKSKQFILYSVISGHNNIERNDKSNFVLYQKYTPNFVA